MDVSGHDADISRVAAAIAEPARTKMLCSLMGGHARTSTELAVIAQVAASTASAHLARLKEGGWSSCRCRDVIVTTVWLMAMLPGRLKH